MNVLRAIKVAEIRKKLAIIPGKILLALLILVGYLLFRSKTFDLMVLKEVVKNDWLYYTGMLVFIYGAISYFSFFLMLIKQWFLGLIASVGIVTVLYFMVGTRDFNLFTMILFVLVMVGPLSDVVNFFRYFNLKNKVIEAEEELQQNIGNGHDCSYNDGFEEGYRRGINAGRNETEAGIAHKKRRKNKRRIEVENAYDEASYDEEAYDDYYIGDDYDKEDDYADGEAYDDSYDYGDDYEGSDYDGSDYYDSDYGDNYDDRGYDDHSEYDGDEDGYGNEAGTNSEDWDASDRQNKRGASKNVRADSSNVAGYFADCRSQREIKRRYHDLCKVYHPDSGNASSDIFCRINEEYEKLMARFGD